jgi:large subunit ribosomal protein L15
MDLSNLPKRKDSKNKKKRIGRGYGSGKGGHTVGLGTKGQKARGRGKIPLGFEGGQVPLYKKIPKIPHFKKRPGKKIIVLPLVKLNRFQDGDKVTPEILLQKKIIEEKPQHGVKIIANGHLHKKLELEGFKISQGARERIEKSGSKIIEK